MECHLQTENSSPETQEASPHGSYELFQPNKNKLFLQDRRGNQRCRWTLERQRTLSVCVPANRSSVVTEYMSNSNGERHISALTSGTFQRSTCSTKGFAITSFCCSREQVERAKHKVVYSEVYKEVLKMISKVCL